jgi:CBS domain-containing protein
MASFNIFFQSNRIAIDSHQEIRARSPGLRDPRFRAVPIGREAADFSQICIAKRPGSRFSRLQPVGARRSIPARPENRPDLRSASVRLCRTSHPWEEERFVMQVRHILQEKGRAIIAIAQTAAVGDAAQLLADKRIGAVLVRDAQNRLSGILSERDVVRAVAVDGPAALARPISDYMTKSVATCRESDTVEDLMEMMTRGRFRHVPVMDEEGLCGLISIGDVVKTRIAETVIEANSLREYISAAV